MRPWSALSAGTVAALMMASSLTAAMNGRSVGFVPWKVLDHASPPSSALMVLYWIPSHPEELRRSEMIHSRTLISYAARCVAMQVVRADDSIRLASLDAAEELPLALLADGEGKIVARLGGNGAPLRASEVEMMVRTVFEQRERRARALLDAAGARMNAGDRSGASELYDQVLAQRCAFPRLAKEAQRAMRRLRR